MRFRSPFSKFKKKLIQGVFDKITNQIPLAIVGSITENDGIFLATYSFSDPQPEKTLAPQILDVTHNLSTVEGVPAAIIDVDFKSFNGYDNISNYAFYDVDIDGNPSTLLKSSTDNFITQNEWGFAIATIAIVTPIQDGGSVTTGVPVYSQRISLP